MVTMTLRGSSAAYYFKYYLGRMDLLGAYVGLQFFGLMIGALMAGYVTKYVDKKKLLMVTLCIVGALSIVFTTIPKPDQSGVVQIDAETQTTLQAAELLNAPIEGQLLWEAHEKTIWIFKKRVALSETTASLNSQDYVGQAVSVKQIMADGIIMDSGKTPKEIYFIFILNFLISVALGFKPPITWGMYADVADFNEWKTGRRATGMTFSATTFSQKLGSTIGSAALLGVLASLGYQANKIQGDASVSGIVYMQTLIPGILAILTALTLIFYKLNQDTLDQIQIDLTKRHGGELG